MRQDVHKVVAERPKSNRTWVSKNPRHKTVLLDVAGEELNEGARHRLAFRQKYRNSRLNIVERFLVNRVGKLWDNVFSEACEVTDARSFQGAEIREALKDLVATGCWLEGHTVMHYNRCGSSEAVTGLYVHPRSGLLLRRAPGQP